MLPTLRPGNRLLVRYGQNPAVGDLVLARFVDGTLAVKRVAASSPTRTGEPGWYLVSDNAAEGIDSRHRGPVCHDDVIAVVRGRVWPVPAPALVIGAGVVLLGLLGVRGCRMNHIRTTGLEGQPDL